MNPLTMLKYKWKFEKNHPKAVEFIKRVLMTEMPEGTVIEMTVTKPGEASKTANIRITKEDLDLMEEIKKQRDQ